MCLSSNDLRVALLILTPHGGHPAGRESYIGSLVGSYLVVK